MPIGHFFQRWARLPATWLGEVAARLRRQYSLALEAGITDFSPGCGSKSVDPDLAASLEARYGSGFASRQVDFATAEDEHEAMYDRGWSDGLPLVPPTPERVARMLEGTSRDRHDIVAVVPPNLVDLGEAFVDRAGQHLAHHVEVVRVGEIRQLEVVAQVS